MSTGNPADDRLAEISRSRLDGDLLASKTLDTETRVANLERRANGVPGPGGPIDYFIPGVTLEYWYRLGEAGPYPSDVPTTPNWARDSSGKNRHLAAVNADRDGNVLAEAGSDGLPTCHIANEALDSTNDDGAMEFNWNEYQWTIWGQKLALIASHSIGMEVPYNGVGDVSVGVGSTFAAWIAYEPPGGAGADTMDPWNSSGVWPTDSNNMISMRPLISTWNRSLEVGNYGCKLGFRPADGHFFYWVGGLNLGHPFSYESGLGFAPGEWVHFVVAVEKLDSLTYQRRLYLNNVKVVDATDTLDSGSYAGLGLSIGGGKEDDIRWAHGRGKVDEVAYWNAALDDVQISRIYNSGTAAAGRQPGDVLTVDANGNPTWVEPTVEVTGGGINAPPLDETPADSGSSSSYAGTPTTSSGWHLNAHVETVVLHDPTPGRFDVPTMKWVRVPFRSITIYRTWEPTIDAAILKTARLKDDRGLMQAAKDGILHINPDMAWPDAPPMNTYLDDALVVHPQHHLIEGWFSIEYPVLDPLYLPENDIELGTLGPTPNAPRPGVSVLAQDGYQRAARFMNVSTGSVLRFHPGTPDRAIGNWWLAATADDSTGAGDGPGTGNLDNPFPIWGDWPARPIHMTPPYPQLNPTRSRDYYQDYQGMAGLGFGPFRGVEAGANLSAGANLCTQAWQDSPWLLRFSTARFPAYRGFDSDYNGFPHLAVTYHYDPDTINHTTGKLLLPA